MTHSSVEQTRLEENIGTVPPWYKWGPYVAERSWATVREDYSATGDAWNYFPFDQAHTKVYRWGEDGIAGWCDRYQLLIFAPAFWNEKDPILKERLFGLSASEGNHGEDVKEYYYHLDGLPSHAYMKYLYKYPQEGFPYQEIKTTNASRSTYDPEYELIDTGIFRENRYFDIFIEYAKISPEDTCIRIEAWNRGDQPAPLHLIPHLWFRNQFSWGETPLPTPNISEIAHDQALCLQADERQMAPPSNLLFPYRLEKRYLYGPSDGRVLFTHNENDYVKPVHNKGAFHRIIVNNETPQEMCREGTKACLQYIFPSVPAQSAIVLRLRLSDHFLPHPLEGIDAIVAQRREEADAFYATIHPSKATEEEKQIQRQAFAGMLWSKQIYLFDVNQWLDGDNPQDPPPLERQFLRNIHWRHLNSMRILAMPDKWEYPWFAAWDLAFLCLTLALIDIVFAKEQLWLLLFDQFQHPNGAIPAYEWEFSDLNPPVQAWVALQLYAIEKERHGREDLTFLKKCFSKLLINFSWWVNRVDSDGWNVFEGGFLGLDNITLIDRSKESKTEGTLRQSDGTGWMAMFCLNLMRLALILVKTDRSYEPLAVKFFEHFVYIAHAMKKRDSQNYELWHDEDGFFYDVLSYPDGYYSKFLVRSLVGIIPLYAVDFLKEEELTQAPEFKGYFHWFLQNRTKLTSDCVFSCQDGYLLAMVTPEQLSRILRYTWDPNEFRSEFGLRSLSKYHQTHIFSYKDKAIGYEPGLSIQRLKGGNSNWRGPVWMPTMYLFIHSLRLFAAALQNSIHIHVPGQKPVTLAHMAENYTQRAISIFRKNGQGQRPVFGTSCPYATDPLFCDYLLFYEYYHGDTGEGLGASHQTGWSALVANLIDESIE